MAKAEEPGNLSELPDSPGAVASRVGGTDSTTKRKRGSAFARTAGAVLVAGPSTEAGGHGSVRSARCQGIAASQPAGVAIAPAKQRRTRTIILRMGAIIGAGVAVGIGGRSYLGYFE